MSTHSSETLHFQKAGPAHLDLLRDMTIRTFRDTYAAHNTEEDMKHHVDTVFHPDRFIEEIADARIGYHIAYLGDVPVGYIRVNLAGVQTDVNDQKSLELERIYVLQDFQGRKFGDQLIAKTFDLAREAGLDYVWLGVWKKNEKAIRFYERMGFTIFGTHDFILGTDPQSDWLMKKMIEDR
jgi:ribosomal protein S18 acetylase RimI-like enzyme